MSSTNNALNQNPTLAGSGGVVLPSGNTASRGSTAGMIRFNTQTSLFESTVDGAAWATIETSAVGVTSIVGTANQVIASSPTGSVTLSLPQSIATSSALQLGSLTFTTTSGIIGTTTNDNAAAGSVGQYISSQIALASKISVSSSTPTDVTSISLTAGDWDVSGNVGISANAANSAQGWISTVSATTPDRSLTSIFVPTSLAFTDYTCVVFTQRISVSTTTTVYLSGQLSFGSGSGYLYGFIGARRVR